MADLHMYTDGSNWVIAANTADATDFYLDHIGMGPEDFDGDYPLPAWKAEPPENELTFWSYRDSSGIAPVDADGAEPVTRTVADWIALLDAGYVASEDY